MIPVPETNFEQPNAGIFLATVIDVEDLGEVASKNPAFPQSKHRVKIVWVLNANDSKGRPYTIAFECPEFTCLCPLTGQPDFAHFTIQYVPKARCVELKSLKLYLWSYRSEGAFHEAVKGLREEHNIADVVVLSSVTTGDGDKGLMLQMFLGAPHNDVGMLGQAFGSAQESLKSEFGDHIARGRKSFRAEK